MDPSREGLRGTFCSPMTVLPPAARAELRCLLVVLTEVVGESLELQSAPMRTRQSPAAMPCLPPLSEQTLSWFVIAASAQRGRNIGVGAARGFRFPIIGCDFLELSRAFEFEYWLRPWGWRRGYGRRTSR